MVISRVTWRRGARSIFATGQQPDPPFSAVDRRVTDAARIVTMAAVILVEIIAIHAVF